MKKATTQASSGQESQFGHILPAQEAEGFLRLLGKDPAKTWFRTITPGGGVNRSRSGRDLHGFDAAALQADNDAGACVYYISGDAERATGKNRRGGSTGCVQDSDITCCRALFAEWDDRPIAWQIRAWKELELPEPTVMVTTGGKSAHLYWVLTEPLDPDAWRALQRRLLAYCDADRSLCNPSRLMRLPGFAYVDKHTRVSNGNRAEVVKPLGGSTPPLTLRPACRHPSRCGNKFLRERLPPAKARASTRSSERSRVFRPEFLGRAPTRCTEISFGG